MSRNWSGLTIINSMLSYNVTEAFAEAALGNPQLKFFTQIPIYKLRLNMAAEHYAEELRDWGARGHHPGTLPGDQHIRPQSLPFRVQHWDRSAAALAQSLGRTVRSSSWI